MSWKNSFPARMTKLLISREKKDVTRLLVLQKILKSWNYKLKNTILLPLMVNAQLKLLNVELQDNQIWLSKCADLPPKLLLLLLGVVLIPSILMSRSRVNISAFNFKDTGSWKLILTKCLPKKLLLLVMEQNLKKVVATVTPRRSSTVIKQSIKVL